MRLIDSKFLFAQLVRAVSVLFGLLLSTTSHAQTCALPPGTQDNAAKAGWTFNPPATCPTDSSQDYAPAPTPIVAPTARIDGTGTAPAKIPYLRHKAGGDPVMGDGEFVETRTDATLTGYGLHYEFTRTYRSRVNYASVLGFGWDHNYNQRLLGVAGGSACGANNSCPPAQSCGSDQLCHFSNDSRIDPACDNSIDFQDGALNRVHFVYAYTSSAGLEYYTAPGISYVFTTFVDTKSEFVILDQRARGFRERVLGGASRIALNQESSPR